MDGEAGMGEEGEKWQSSGQFCKERNFSGEKKERPFVQKTMMESFFPDPPGKAFIELDAEEVVKGDTITLTCEVDDPGRPEAETFVWMRGLHVVSTVSGANWTIDPVTLETEANISCVATNAVGEGIRDSISIEVFGT